MRAYTIVPNSRIAFEIRYADDDVLVVDKPSGIVTEPGKGHERDSLLNGLFVQYGDLLQNLGEARDWGLLHRLDRDTSGLVLVGLRNRAYDRLREQFTRRAVKKIYLAIVRGRPEPRQGVIQKPIKEIVGTRKKAVIHREGEQAITAYEVVQFGERASLVRCRPKTGRLHQIRVHMADMNTPVLGDAVYSVADQSPRVPRLCLHAAELSFMHPTTGHPITVQAPWPRDLLRCLKSFKLSAPA